jgi:hypothetical protein
MPKVKFSNHLDSLGLRVAINLPFLEAADITRSKPLSGEVSHSLVRVALIFLAVPY